MAYDRIREDEPALEPIATTYSRLETDTAFNAALGAPCSGGLLTRKGDTTVPDLRHELQCLRFAFAREWLGRSGGHWRPVYGIHKRMSLRKQLGYTAVVNPRRCAGPKIDVFARRASPQTGAAGILSGNKRLADTSSP